MPFGVSSFATRRVKRTLRRTNTPCDMRRALLGILTTLALWLPGRSSGQVTQSHCGPGQSFAELNVNGVTTRVHNNATQFTGGGPRYEVPAGGGVEAFSSSELWMGGKVGGDIKELQADWLTTVTTPGPLHRPGAPIATCDTYDRIYTITRSEVEIFDSTGVATSNLIEWPWELGAPVIDGDGIQGNYDLAGGDRPRVEGHQMHWWIMNDAGSSDSRGGLGDPMGMEIRVSAFGAASDDPVIQNATFFRYSLTYKGSEPLEDVYFGNYVEPTLGDVTDNFVGSDTALGLAFSYNANEFDYEYGDKPPAVGIAIVEGFPGYDGEPLPMTKFMAPDVYAVRNILENGDVYDFLRGVQWDGVPFTYGGNGRGFSETPVDFMFPGEPGEFWSEENTDGTGSRAGTCCFAFFVWSTGPFNLDPGETKDIVFAILWARGEDRLDSLRELKKAVPRVRQAWGAGFDVPLPPPPTDGPVMLSPASQADDQPTNLRLIWSPVDHAPRYEIQFSRDYLFRTILDEIVVTETFADVQLKSDSHFWWRVRGLNAGQGGPWAKCCQSVSTGHQTLVAPDVFRNQPGGLPAFIVVEHPYDEEPCVWTDNSAGSSLCYAFGSPYVYGYSDFHGWRMSHQGPGPESSLAAFAPSDFEIRFTEHGSYAGHPFDSHLGIHVPWEVWDVGDVGLYGVNDPADDVQLIGSLVSPSGGDCAFEFGETLDNDSDWPATDQIFAHYPVAGSSYSDWVAGVGPLIDGSADGCVDVTASETLIDFDRGRPIQGIVFEMDPSHPDFRSEGIPTGNVVRFLTTRPTPPHPSAPTSSALTTRTEISFWWQIASDSLATRFQISLDHDFRSVVLDTVLTGRNLVLDLERGLLYYWRVAYAIQPNAWSPVSRLEMYPLVSAVDGEIGIPEVLSIETPYPNPVRSLATIEFTLPSMGPAELEIYDILGRRVETVFSAPMSAGTHVVQWNASTVSQGVYILSLRAGGRSESARMVVTR